MITFEKNAKLLTVTEKPYSIDGNTGLSRKARFLVGDEIFVFKLSEEHYKALSENQGKEFLISIGLSSPKETVRIDLVAFQVND